MIATTAHIHTNKEFYDAWRPWALGLCKKWDFSANIPEIAQQIKSLGKKSGTPELLVLRDVFNEYFADNHGDAPTITQFEAITQCLEHLEAEEGQKV